MLCWGCCPFFLVRVNSGMVCCLAWYFRTLSWFEYSQVASEYLTVTDISLWWGLWFSFYWYLRFEHTSISEAAVFKWVVPKMATTSVNVSLDDIDLSALRVSVPNVLVITLKSFFFVTDICSHVQNIVWCIFTLPFSRVYPTNEYSNFYEVSWLSDWHHSQVWPTHIYIYIYIIIKTTILEEHN